jgi:hypothetical protein
MRPTFAPSGSKFLHNSRNLTKSERQQAAVEELLRGNIPSFLRTLKPVVLKGVHQQNSADTAVVWVMPDYLAIGSNHDFVRIPLSYPSAVHVAREFGFVLPTRKLVDAIEEQAELHLKPQPLPAGSRMRSNDYYLRHQHLIEAQRGDTVLGKLMCGHKKDLVITRLLFKHPGRVAIYGWHRLNGKPIQPLSTIHGETYEDYSHGVRLVWPTARIDREATPILEALADPHLGPLFTYEGTIPNSHRLFAL